MTCLATEPGEVGFAVRQPTVTGPSVMAIVATAHRAIQVPGDRALSGLALGELVVRPDQVFLDRQSPRLKPQVAGATASRGFVRGGIVQGEVTTAALS